MFTYNLECKVLQPSSSVLAVLSSEFLIFCNVSGFSDEVL